VPPTGPGPPGAGTAIVRAWWRSPQCASGVGLSPYLPTTVRGVFGISTSIGGDVGDRIVRAGTWPRARKDAKDRCFDLVSQACPARSASSRHRIWARAAPAVYSTADNTQRDEAATLEGPVCEELACSGPFQGPGFPRQPLLRDSVIRTDQVPRPDYPKAGIRHKNEKACEWVSDIVDA